MLAILRCLGVLITYATCCSLAYAEDSLLQPEVDIGETFSISDKYQVGDEFMSARLLGAIRVKTKAVKGEKPRELSGLAWDEDEKILVAVSDDGLIVHLRPIFTATELTDLKMVAIFPLLGKNGEPLAKDLRDAEGLVGHDMSNGVRGDSRVSISFEQSPRIDTYTLNGEFLNSNVLPAALNARDNYAGDNKELESVAEHPRYGLITAPERPLRNAGTQAFSLYGMDGSVWQYPSLDHEHSALVGMETMPNGNLLVLERRFASMFQPIIFALRELQLNDPIGHEAKLVREVIKFSSTDGWKIDNFEAVAHHRDNHYFVISDDNESMLQKTLLIYLQIMPNEAAKFATSP